MAQRIDTDRHGVPQFNGDPELYDEYEERAWDLWHGRDGQPALQAATAVHLRAGLSGAAYEAVRKLEHTKIKTKDSDGNPTDKGLRAFLETLKGEIAAVKPVKINELFITAFYSPQVWRRPQESMQQYIIRREQDFRRLEEVGSGTSVPKSLRAMMLLLFGGLSPQEQVSVLSSVNNDYDFEKIANAMRIQFPQASGKPVHRRDLLGCGRTTPAARDSGILFRRGYKPGKGRGRPQHVLTSEIDIEGYDDAFEYYDDEAYMEDEDEEYEAPNFDGAEAFWEDDGLEALAQDLQESEGNEEVAEALATVMQFKKGKGKGKGKKGKASPASSQSLPFRASGDISFDAKAKEQRNTAVKFLKSVTACTSCGQKGHWVGDDACPNTKKKKQKSHRSGLSPPKKKSDSKTTFFVLHEGIESDDEKEINATFTLPEYDTAPEYVKATDFDELPSNAPLSENKQVPADEKITESAPGNTLEEPNDVEQKPVTAPTEPVSILPHYIDSVRNYQIDGPATTSGASFTMHVSPIPAREVLMVLKDTQLCEHSSYFGGNEREFHRGANGHTRHVTCKDKDCDKTVIVAKRKDASQLWRYMVQIALCTNWGRAARSRELFANVCKSRDRALAEDEERQALQPPQGYPRQPGSPSTASWEHASRSKDGSSPSSATARIVRPGASPEPRFWAYGVLISPSVELPMFPPLAEADYDILQPLPGDTSVFGPGTPYEGYDYASIASSAEASVFCHQTMKMALEDQPMAPETYRFAFYLFGRVRLLHSSTMRQWKGSATSGPKRTANPDEMVAQRHMRVPISVQDGHPEMVQLHDFEVLMAFENLMTHEAADDHERLDMETTYASSAQDPPGLAILDSGCTRTMHGAEWATAFEAELEKIGLSSQRRLKKQSFKGVGGQIASDTVKIFPVGISKVNGELHSAEAPGGLPLLLSRPFMEELQTVIDIGARTVSFNKIGVSGLPLVRTSRGHLVVSLLDFDMDSIQDQSPEHKSNDHEESMAQDIAPKSPTQSELDDCIDPDMVHDYEGMNPDDYHDEMMARELFLDEARAIRDAYERDLRGSATPAPGEHGLICEDVNFIDDNPDQFIVRKATNKKSKKIESWDNALHGQDWHHRQVISGSFKKVSTKPPYGKTWMKQLFAGQMGLSLLAIMVGFSIGIPLDSSSSTWDANSSKGYKRVCHDLLVEDPYLTVITQACGPWGNWSSFNLARGGHAAVTVMDLREANKPTLYLVNKITKDRIKAKRHVFIEQPLGSTWLKQPECADILKYIEDNTLLAIRVDGCQVGYKDAESGLPNKKPSLYVTTLLAAESVFQGCLCDNSHQHEHLEGNNKYGSRTAQASVWPHTLNEMVLQAMVQQASAEATASYSTAEAFPSEVRPADGPPGEHAAKRRKKKGRVAQLVGQYAAPPVYIRPINLHYQTSILLKKTQRSKP